MRTAHGFSSHMQPSVMRSRPSYSDVTCNHPLRVVLSPVCSLSSLALPSSHLSFSPLLSLSSFPLLPPRLSFYHRYLLHTAYLLARSLLHCAQPYLLAYNHFFILGKASTGGSLAVCLNRSAVVLHITHSFFAPFLLKGALGQTPIATKRASLSPHFVDK